MNNTELLTIKEVAQTLRVDPSTVKRWIEGGALQAIALPRRSSHGKMRYRIRRSTLDTLLSTTK